MGAIEVQRKSTCLGLPVTFMRFSGVREARDIHVPDATVAVNIRGNGRRKLTIGHQQMDVQTAPGMVAVCGSGREINEGNYRGTSGELIAIQFPEDVLNGQILDNDRCLRLRTDFEAFDPRISWLASSIWNDMSSDHSDPLYSQGLMLALIGVLRQSFAEEFQQAGKEASKFSRDRRIRLVDLIEQQLGEPLSVERLAREVDLSPQHFSRVFRNTFEQTPHAFLLSKRIDAACRTLGAEPERPISDIALAYGFSSQAHFTRCFKEFKGATPARWRRQ